MTSKCALPHIVLLVIDALRARHLGLYGYERPVSPVLDELGAEGVVFEAAFTQAPFTMASTASLYTGLYPSTHRTIYYDHVLPSEYETLPRVLKAGGYTTAAFVANPHINPKSGYARHFDFFDEGRPWWRRHSRLARRFSRHRWGEDAAWLTRAMTRHLTRQRAAPFFLFGFYIDTHAPYTQPLRRYRRLMSPATLTKIAAHQRQADFLKHPMSDDDIRTIVDMYDAEIRWVDRHVGRLVSTLKRRGVWERTLFIVTSDHGEGFDNRPWRGGHGQLYEKGTHVPLILHWPEMWSEGKRISHLVGLIDLLPTVAELVGRPLGAGQVHGHSLLPLLRGEGGVERSVIFSETAIARMARTLEWKYIDNRGGCDLGGRGKEKITRRSPEVEELYYLPEDPLEEHNLAAERPATLGRMRRQLAGFQASYVSDQHSQGHTEFDDEFLARLRGLGYID